MVSLGWKDDGPFNFKWELAFLHPCLPECDVPVPGIADFFGGIGTGIGKNWYRKKVSEPVSEKFGTGKRSQNRYRKNLVPELIFGAKIFEFRRFIMGINETGNFSFFWWYRKNLVPEKSLGTGIG